MARLVALNGQPLSAQANQAELDRLNTLANHPEIQLEKGSAATGCRKKPEQRAAGLLAIATAPRTIPSASEDNPEMELALQ